MLGPALKREAMHLDEIPAVRGRRERRRDEELIVFYANPRDPEMTDALTMACERLNDRDLTRGGRRLRYVIEDPAGHSS